MYSNLASVEAFADFNWGQDLNLYTNGGVVDPNTPLEFSPSGIMGGIIGGANLQIGQWIFGAEHF